jgi:hypothetical protein
MALNFTPEQTGAILGLLGLPTDTDDPDVIVTVLQDALADAAANDQGDDPSADMPTNAIAAAARKAGLELVDSATIAELRQAAKEGRRMAAEARKAELEGIVNAAVAKGKITPARKQHWVTLIDADPGMADVLASVPDETAVPLTEVGHGLVDDGTLPENQQWFR